MRRLGEYSSIPAPGWTPDAHGYHSWIFSVMFSPTIMLLIGGFTIAAALSKTNIDRVLITRVLSLAGTRPSVVLLAVMGVACFASMWIRCGDSLTPIVFAPRVLTLSCPFSNVAAPTLCFTLVRVRLNYCYLLLRFSHAHLAYRSQSCGLSHRRHPLGLALS